MFGMTGERVNYVNWDVNEKKKNAFKQHLSNIRSMKLIRRCLWKYPLELTQNEKMEVTLISLNESEMIV